MSVFSLISNLMTRRALEHRLMTGQAREHRDRAEIERLKAQHDRDQEFMQILQDNIRRLEADNGRYQGFMTGYTFRDNMIPCGGGAPPIGRGADCGGGGPKIGKGADFNKDIYIFS